MERKGKGGGGEDRKGARKGGVYRDLSTSHVHSGDLSLCLCFGGSMAMHARGMNRRSEALEKMNV